MTLRTIGLTGLVLIALTGSAHAQTSGFMEAGVGVDAPLLGGGGYTDDIGPGSKLALRGGYIFDRWAPRLRWSVELGGDWTRFGDDVVPSDGQVRDVRFHRIRVLMGPRAIYRLRPGFHVWGRAGVGFEIFNSEETGSFAGNEFTDSDADLGLALELGGGAAWNLGKLAVGVAFDVPMSLQPSDGPSDVTIYDADWFAVDVALLLIITSTL